MQIIRILTALVLLLPFSAHSQHPGIWIRINQLGYSADGYKTAVLVAKTSTPSARYEVIDAATSRTVYAGATGKSYGAYGPFSDTRRLDFSPLKKEGRYYIKAGDILSDTFAIGKNVYDGAADFCLRYMRQQRSGFNPFLKDSCHTHDGYTLYAPVPDSTHIDVTGGWHDASDYLQYAATSANATWHLLAAWRDFPGVFADQKQANGLDGANKIPDVLDEAKWGLDWLLKMHPQPHWLFNQVGDDRDHRGMRIPKEDTNFYGRGLERPVYFATGQPQVRGKFMNHSTGVASTAGKFTAAFALGSQLFTTYDSGYTNTLALHAATAFQLGLNKPGVCQTASVLSPYIYAEDNWTDDMELATAAMSAQTNRMTPMAKKGLNDLAWQYAQSEPITPWLGKDTANHYQWYPFINLGHYELVHLLKDRRRDTLITWYRQGIDRVWQKARANAFYHAIPFIWCSNNLTVSFAIQCYWYRHLTGDNTYLPLEQACFDWLFGCNPWGTSMVYGLPAGGDTPADPHSAFTHLKSYPIDGGLVDGPVYTSIYDHLIGIRLTHDDPYKDFQSNLAVYHDDYGDYSTNEPTMDGTASLIYLLAARQAEANSAVIASAPVPHLPESPSPTITSRFTFSNGGIIRGDSSRKAVALVFTGDEFGEGLPAIIETLKNHKTPASFFFTGRFYRNPAYRANILQLKWLRCYLGPHSNDHLLYNDWTRRDSLLVTAQQFRQDFRQNLIAMRSLGIDTVKAAHWFIPPYEWYNDSVAAWAQAIGWPIVNYTPGIRTNADYTWPEMGDAYLSSEGILQSLRQFRTSHPAGLDGAIILIHAGADPHRQDKFYNHLEQLIAWLRSNGYACVRIDQLLSNAPLPKQTAAKRAATRSKHRKRK